MTKNVLISGAGVAGATLAYWLARNGFKPTVVELSEGVRSSGNPVDVLGPALPVVEAMGLVPRLREVTTTARRIRLLRADGTAIATMGMPGAGKGFEVPRADLAAVLYEAARDDAEFLFDDTITALRQDTGGVDVTFDRAAPRRFDLVVGADGLHSTVRRLAFGQERDFVRPIGLYVATAPFTEPVDHPAEDVLLHNAPGRLVGIHPSRGKCGVAFIFRGAVVDFDSRDADQHKRIVTEAYRGVGWRVPELLRRFQASADVYFDAVSIVDLPSWSSGRIALVGDAASCVSLLGDGSSLAIAGAHTLARALVSGGLDRYEAEHRALVTPKQRAVRPAAAVLVPRTALGLATRNLAARLWRGGR